MKRFLLVVLSIPSLAAAQVIPTPEWISVWSDNTTFNMRPVQPGSVVRAYDPQGVLCGEFTVTAAGSFGLMPVYRDDPFTALVDEGAEPGDVITFEVDGITAAAGGPDAPTWTANGAVKKINLACEKVIPTAEWISIWSDATTVRGAPVQVGSVVRAYDPQGALCGEYTVQVEGEFGLMAVYRDDAFTINVDEGAEPGDVISFEIDGYTANPQGPDDTVWGSNGQVKNVDLDVPSVAVLLTSARLSVQAGVVSIVWRLARRVDTRNLSMWRRAADGDAWGRFVRLEGTAVERSAGEYFFSDAGVRSGCRYGYRVEVAEDTDHSFVDLGVVELPGGRFVLRQNSPNPFHAGTTIEFELPEETAVDLAVFDVQGKLVRRLINQRVMAAETHRVEWDGFSDAGVQAAAGVYFIRIRTETWNAVRKLALIR